MSLRIQSSVDKTTWTGAPTASMAPQEELEPIREPIKDAIKNPAKKTSPLATPLSKQEEIDKETVEEAVESINGAIEHINRGLRFSVHEDTQRIMVKVVDMVTQEVIKEIPPEDVLDTAARIREAIGLLIDERA